jgi:hypothetical protein
LKMHLPGGSALFLPRLINALINSLHIGFGHDGGAIINALIAIPDQSEYRGSSCRITAAAPSFVW